jgi:hypothetical protein
MDAGLIGLIAVAVVIAGAVYFARPAKVLPLEELLGRLTHIHNDPQLTAAQKLHLAELAYRGFEGSTVSVVGGIHDVHANNAVIMKTASKELPLIGIELARISPDQLRTFDKGKALTLRVRLPPWARYSDIVGLPVGFREAKVFYAGRWYGVKSTYRVRDPNEPKTGEFKAVTKTGEFTALTKTGTFKALQ